MRSSTRHAIAFVGAIVLFAFQPTLPKTNSAPTDASPDTAFADLKSAVTVMNEKFGPAAAGDETADRITHAAGALNAKYVNSGKVCSMAYASSIENDADIIRAAATEPDPSKASAMLRDASADLSTKLSHARAHSSLEESLGDPVDVTVTTIQGSNAVRGYFVRCNPARWPDADPMIVFNDATNPTAENKSVPPGNYICWAEQPPSKKRIGSEPEAFGASGQTAQPISLLIPAAGS
jgi:hypothetical protein